MPEISPTPLTGRKRAIVTVIRDNFASAIGRFVEDQFSHGADIEDVERQLKTALRQIERVNNHWNAREIEEAEHA